MCRPRFLWVYINSGKFDFGPVYTTLHYVLFFDSYCAKYHMKSYQFFQLLVEDGFFKPRITCVLILDRVPELQFANNLKIMIHTCISTHVHSQHCPKYVYHIA